MAGVCRVGPQTGHGEDAVTVGHDGDTVPLQTGYLSVNKELFQGPFMAVWQGDLIPGLTGADHQSGPGGTV